MARVPAAACLTSCCVRSVVVTCKDVVLREDDHDGADEEIAISHEAGEAGASTKEGERPQEAAAKGVQHST